MKYALQRFAQQAEVQILFDSAAVEGKTSAPVDGLFDAETAVREILRSSDLAYQFSDQSTVVVFKRVESRPRMRSPAPAQNEALHNEPISEIVVTARKTTEFVQDVPLSISAFSSQAMEDKQVRDLRDVTYHVPGLEFFQTTTREFERPVIRGQSTILSATESGVTTFVDGLSFHASISTLSIAELERVEVIKGPQSSLHGRNTYAGAINLITQKPTGEPSSHFSMLIAQTGEREVTANLTRPVIDEILNAGVFVRHYEYRGEHINQFDGRYVGGERSDSASLIFTLKPGDSMDLIGRFNYGRDNDGPPAMYITPDTIKNVGFETGGDVIAAFYKGRVPTFPVNYDSEFVADPGFEQDRYWLSLQATWSPDETTSITSLTGFQKSDQVVQLDADLLPRSIFLPTALVSAPKSGSNALTAVATGGGVDNRDRRQTWQQELRLASDDRDRSKTFIGVYYYRDKRTDSRLADSSDELRSHQYTEALAALRALVFPSTISTVLPPADRRRIIWRNTTNLAAFGKFDFKMTDTVTLSGEARYQQESLKFSVFEFSANTITFDDRDTFSAFVPRVTIEYAPTTDHLLYAATARGTKPGGVNDDGGFDPLVNAPTFDEENIWSYELGSRNSMGDSQLILNGAAYFNHLSNYQTLEGVVQSDSTPDTIITNNGTVDIWGLEMQASYRPRGIPRLTTELSFAYNDSRLGRTVTDRDQGVLDDIFDDGRLNCSLGNVDPRLNRCRSRATSVAGNRLPRSSKYQIAASANYEHAISRDHDWFLTADASYRTSQFVSALNIADFGEALIMNASSGIKNDRLRFALWAKNLFDETSPTSVINFVNLSSFESTLYGSLRRGRQFGLSLVINL